MHDAEVRQQAGNQPVDRQGKSGPGVESPQGGQIAQLETLAGNSPQASAQRKAVQRINQSPSLAAQRQTLDSARGDTAQRTAAIEPNRTGLPDGLKSGIESLSGMPMDDVKVHYNSDKPAQLNALAYAQGTDIHVAPGQEKHLPHEAWHVVQQKQGRVQATTQAKALPVNDAAPAGPDRLAVGGLIQLKWIGDGENPVVIWDRQLDGLRWFYDLGTDLMYYEIEDVSDDVGRHLRANAGASHARTREQWADAGFGGGDWSDSDAEIVPFVPASTEKIKLGNSKREITRESLESQAAGFVAATTKGSPEALFAEFREQVGPLMESARAALGNADKIPSKQIDRLIEVFTSLDPEAHEQSESIKGKIDEEYKAPELAGKYKTAKAKDRAVASKKDEVLIRLFKDRAIADMIDVAEGRLAVALENIARFHGPENHFDALTATSMLLKRFAGNTNMSDLTKLIEVYNLVQARLVALNLRKTRPIRVEHAPLDMREFPRSAPSLKLGSSLMTLEKSYDVLSRRTGAVTDTGIIHIHEVDLAFVKVFKGVTEAYANPTKTTGDELVFGGGGGVGEKVFAADHRGSMDFRADVKKREERFYGLIFPKGFVAHFGMDISDKAKFDPVGPERSKLKGSVREPNEAEFALHRMPELNGDPEIAIPLKTLFFVRAETSTPGGQVDIHFGWRDMQVNGRPTHHPDFFRQNVLGVVEFTKNGLIIRYQRLA